jgi:hypothetical protein
MVDAGYLLSVSTPVVEENVLDIKGGHLSLITRRVSSQLGVSHCVEY